MKTSRKLVRNKNVSINKIEQNETKHSNSKLFLKLTYFIASQIVLDQEPTLMKTAATQKTLLGAKVSDRK